MQTPASIKKQVEPISNFLLTLSNAPLISNVDLIIKNKGKENNNNSTKNGTVLVNGLPVTMSKSQVLDLLKTKNTKKFAS